MGSESFRLVRYAKWRAVMALIFPIALILIPVANLAMDKSDFVTRYVDQPISTGLLLIGLIWFIYSLWPGAFRRLRENNFVSTCERALILADGRRLELSRVRSVSVQKVFLRHSQVVLVLHSPSETLALDSAFQDLQNKRSCEEIADLIRKEISSASGS